MKKIFFLVLLLLTGAVAHINAQVTVGYGKKAESFSALEIVSNGSNALRLPRLTEAQRDALAISGQKLAEGLLIYNTDTKCLDYWNGSGWINLCEGSIDEDVSGKYRLSGKTCFDVKQGNDNATCAPLTARTNDFASTKSFSYTFSSPTGSTYSNLNFWVSDKEGLVAGTNTASNVFTITFRDDIATIAAGTDRTTAKKVTIIAQYKDNTNADKQVSLTVSVQDCGCGCTVKSTLGGGWLTFMCYNLGVSEATKDWTIAEQMAYPSPTNPIVTDVTVYGDLYQWGRKADGHEKRNSQTYLTNNNSGESSPIANSGLDGNGQVLTTHAAYGKFIKNDAKPYDWHLIQNDNLWGNPKTVNDPCPAGWRIPTQTEWRSIFNGNGNNITNSTSWITTNSGNKVRWSNSSTKGIEVSADGTNTALFLPAAGTRFYNGGSFQYGGTGGHYWSSTTYMDTSFDPSKGSYGFIFGSSSMTMSSPQGGISHFRAFGYSVRCVAE